LTATGLASGACDVTIVTIDIFFYPIFKY